MPGDSVHTTDLANVIFCMGGIIIPEESWHNIAQDFFELKKKHGIDRTTEVKWTDLRSSKGPLAKLGRDGRDEFRNALFSWIGQLEAMTIVAVRFNKKRAVDEKWYINTNEDVYRYAFQFLLERFHRFLEDLGNVDAHGIVIQDPRGKKEDKALRKFYADLGMFGTYFVNFRTLVEALLLVPSQWSVGVQLADLCTGAIHRKLVSQDSEDYDKIESRIRRGPSGQIKGWGVVYFP